MTASLYGQGGHTIKSALVVAFLVLAIFFVGIDSTPQYASSSGAGEQIAQAAVGSPENPANMSTSAPAGSTCVKEIDEEWRSICKRKSETESAKQKRPVTYVLQKKILDDTGTRCAHQCVLKEQNTQCQEKEKTLHKNTEGELCWVCGNDFQTFACRKTKQTISEEFGDVEAQIDAQQRLKPLEEKLARGENLTTEEIETWRQAKDVLAFNNRTDEIFGMQEYRLGDPALLDDLTTNGKLPEGALGFFPGGQTGGQVPSGDVVPTTPQTPQTPQAPARSVGTARPATPPSGPFARSDSGIRSGFGSGYRSLQPFTPSGAPQTSQENGGGLGNFVRSFLGNVAPGYETPQGLLYEGPVVAYAPVSSGGIVIREPTPHLRSIREIASDVAAETQTSNLPRVDHFAQTLSRVGGPSTTITINTENASFGRIQDLIVEDEAIRAMFVAEQTAGRAKNRVFCLSGEKSEDCLARRSETAERIERETFIEELERRDIPRPALEHFLAVYDGWVRPSPAPRTRATSTLGALFRQEQDPSAAYELGTSGNNFVLWILENVKDTTKSLVDTVAGLLLGGRK